MKKTARSSAALAAPPATVRRYEALLALQGVKDHRQALDLLLDATGARGAALFLQGEPGAVTIRGRLRGTKREQEQRRTECLRVGSGIVENGICAELRGPEGARPGVIYLETARDSIPGDLQSFLDVAGVILGASLPPVQIALAASPTAKPMASGLSTRTRTLSPILLASEAPCMRKVVSLVQKCRDSILPILLTGESGSGKDHLARWIHSLSPRREAPFVAQDCSAIPSALLEAEILGYEAGAFSGADRARAGCLMQAQSGTFYLDNVDSLLPEVQAKLIRVLATRTVRPLGSATLHHLDVRLISSSQRDLRDLVERGEFRRDLYFRLAGIPITVPSLRERAEDVPLLVAHFCSQLGGKQPAFTPEARAVLQQHSWPGNIRELESVVRRLALTSDASIDDRQVRAVLGLAAANSSFPHWAFAGRTYEQVVEEVKREYLLHLFKTQRGDMQQIARELGLTKRNAYLRYAQLGLRPQELRAGGAI